MMGAIPDEILSLKIGLWRKNEAQPHVIHNMVYGMHSLAYTHGAFHWVGISRNYFVVSFNISHEVYGEIFLPEQICLMNSVNIGISAMEGTLCAYCNVYHQGNHTFKLWVMKDYGLKESWSSIFIMVVPDIRIYVPKYRTQRGSFTLLARDIAQKEFTFTESLISPRLLT
ncbi:hypothetical protein H5410_029869 [Solanum commersonii]|uniref:F-box associated domain-containing protein n=1 Tax=Solanum commersonii TaxID=4109 RepID=A0A9J5YCP1_SOLCO|nr:hypothetical protein H5410_029869 [Solanum commersonii]